MDTSDKYIEMCRKTTEIQESHTPAVGDWYFFINTNPEDMVVCNGEEHEYDMLRPWAGYCPASGYDEEVTKSTWIPRQDQLYELHSLHGTEPGAAYLICRTFGIWLNSFRAYIDAPSIENQRFYSIEQLLLAFVMEDINKRWDGSDWVVL